MKLFLFAIVALLAVSATQARMLEDNEYEMIFSKWVKQHSKEYKTMEDMLHRFTVFKDNMDTIISHERSGNTDYKLAMNEFGDLTNEEFRGQMNNYKPELIDNSRIANLSTKNLPASVDWVTAGAVTPVKNQGQCGSCWSFSTTGAMEGIHEITTGKLVSFSEQELVDCSTSAGNQGCNGGLMDNAFGWIIQNGGLCTEAAYPYKAADGTCHKSTCTSAGTITGYKNVPANDEDALQAAVAQQPVSIAVDAAGGNWQFYSSGIMTGTCGTSLDHGVLAVGYGTSGGKDYWIVKNSWGPTWGMSGYLWLPRGTGSGNPGFCGIAMSPSFPTM